MARKGRILQQPGGAQVVLLREDERLQTPDGLPGDLCSVACPARLPHSAHPSIAALANLSIESLVQGGTGTGEGMSPRDPMADRTWDPSQGAEGILLCMAGGGERDASSC